jgi:hypothetical protein
MKPEVFDELYAKCVAHYNGLNSAYVFDGFCGANPASRKKVGGGDDDDDDDDDVIMMMMLIMMMMSLCPLMDLLAMTRARRSVGSDHPGDKDSVARLSCPIIQRLSLP